jgi:hypothetical protein
VFIFLATNEQCSYRLDGKTTLNEANQAYFTEILLYTHTFSQLFIPILKHNGWLRKHPHIPICGCTKMNSIHLYWMRLKLRIMICYTPNNLVV